MKNKIAITIILLTGILFTSCNTVQTEENGGGHAAHEPTGIVSLTPLQMKTLDLKIISLEEKSMSQAIQVSGNLELAPQDKADISPIMGGIIKRILVIEGDRVKKGQVLATMQHPDFIQLQQEYANAINSFEYTEKEYLRSKNLFEQNVNSAASHQKITAEYKTSKSTIAALKIKLSMLGLNSSSIAAGKIYSSINITSPFSGTVSLVETNVGAFAEPMSKLFEVVNNNKLHADFMVYEKDINKIKVGQTVYFNTSSVDEHEFKGEIHAISPVFEDNPKALHVHADILNKTGQLIPGMYINGRIIADTLTTKVVPDAAIVLDNEKNFIFVKTKQPTSEHDHDEADDHDHSAENKKINFIMVEVVVGLKNAGFSEVKLLNNLPKDIQIAGNAAYFLLAEMRKEEVEHTH